MLSWLRRYAPIFKWLLAVGLLTALFWFNREGLADLGRREIGWSLFAAAVGVRFGSLCLTFLRWWLLVTGIGLPFTVKEAFRLGLLGEACNFEGLDAQQSDHTCADDDDRPADRSGCTVCGVDGDGDRFDHRRVFEG